jgi:hypothetical protein
MPELLGWQTTPGIWSERHEAGNQFGVDPIRFGPRSAVCGKSLDLGGSNCRAAIPAASSTAQSGHSCPPVASKQTRGMVFPGDLDQLLMPGICIG